MLYKKNNSKFWYTKFDLTFGDKTKRVNRSTKETTRAKAESVEQQIRVQAWEQLRVPDKQAHAWDEAIQLYLGCRQANKTVGSKERKLIWWKTNLDNDSINISSSEIFKALAKRPDLKLATKNRYLSEIKSFLNFTHKELEWIDRVPHIKTFKELEKPFYKLSEDAIERLLAASPAFMRPVIIFAISTGFRSSNITSLTWCKVDLDKKLIRIDAANHKSGSAMLHPINQTVVELLKNLKEVSNQSHVFLSERGSPMKDLNRRIWHRVCKSVGLDGLRFHDLRHNWASRHAEKGSDILAIKELGGWKTLDMVRRYTHPSLDYLSLQANNIVTKDINKDVAKPSCDKKSSHFVDLGGIKVIKDEGNKWKNLITFNKLSGLECGAQTRNRTKDTRIFNPLLYQLSYLGIN
jgi:integrase